MSIEYLLKSLSLQKSMAEQDIPGSVSVMHSSIYRVFGRDQHTGLVGRQTVVKYDPGPMGYQRVNSSNLGAFTILVRESVHGKGDFNISSNERWSHHTGRSRRKDQILVVCIRSPLHGTGRLTREGDIQSQLALDFIKKTDTLSRPVRLLTRCRDWPA